MQSRDLKICGSLHKIAKDMSLSMPFASPGSVLFSWNHGSLLFPLSSSCVFDNYSHLSHIQPLAIQLLFYDYVLCRLCVIIIFYGQFSILFAQLFLVFLD